MAVLTGITILLALAWCATGLCHRASAAWKHAAWTCAIIAVLMLGPLHWRMPQRVQIPIAQAFAAPEAAVVTEASPTSNVSRTDLTLLVPGIWAVGSFIMLLRLLRNGIRLRSIVGTADGDGAIRVSSNIQGPLVAGLVRPVILLPVDSESWTDSRRAAVLAHESAHVRRHDPAILLAAHFATALYWFHPLCWLAAARLRAESERACDDAALNTGLLASDYAAHLLDMACKFDTQLAIPMASTSHLETRVKSILDPAINRTYPARGGWLVAIALTVAVVAPLATLTLEAQQSGSTSTTIAGTVTDPSGAVVPNARLSITNSESGWEQTGTVNAAGVYSFSGIPAGHYAIEVQQPGFAKFQLANQTVVSGARLQVDPRLDVGRVSQVVTVSGQRGPKPAADPSAPAPKRIRVGGMVQAARLIRQQRPVYPTDLQEQGIEGSVIMSAIISKDGTPIRLSVQNPSVNAALISAAIDAVNQWRYQPTLLNGEPIEVLTTIQVDFTLK